MLCKRVKRCVMATVIFAIIIFTIGCSGKGSTGDTNTHTAVPPKPQLQVESPTVCSIGSKVVWDSCENAMEYDVYVDGQFIATTLDCYYTVDNISDNVTVKVKAKNGEYFSDFSNETIVFNNEDINESQILQPPVIDDWQGKVITVESNIRKIVIKSDTRAELKTIFSVEERTQDLIFELKNITLKLNNSNQYFIIRTKDGLISRNKHDWSLIINVEGDCYINAEKTFPPLPVPDKNSGESGYQGDDGGVAVRITSLAICGDGNLTFVGGNGEDGGRGADANLLSTNSYGHGGNGGRGGNALECKHLLVDMQPTGTFTLIDGKGGNGGSHGSDAKAITPNIAHFTHTEEQCNGKVGRDGASVIVSLYTLGGTFVY